VRRTGHAHGVVHIGTGASQVGEWPLKPASCSPSNASGSPSNTATPSLILHPLNPLQLEPWKLEAEDTKLLDMIPFLEAVVRTGGPDVRSVIKSYEGQDIPLAFRERMSRLQSASKTKKGFLGFGGGRS